MVTGLIDEVEELVAALNNHDYLLVDEEGADAVGLSTGQQLQEP